jgi:hypothetical protein
MKEKVDLVRRLAEFRRIHKRDQRRIEDVLSEVKTLCLAIQETLFVDYWEINSIRD